MPLTDHFELPPELARWGWAMQQMKAGPRKHPGGWWQFIFWRCHGLAAGDDDLAPNDPSLRVKVRRATLDEALTAAIQEMHRISAILTPSDDYAERFAELGRLYTPVIWTIGYPPERSDEDRPS